MIKSKISKANLILFSILVILVVLSIWKTREFKQHSYLAFRHSPEKIMGTNCNLVAVVKPLDFDAAKSSIDNAEAKIRNIEATMSIYIDASPITRFNRSDAGVVDLNPEIVEILLKARSFHKQTEGTFDITVKPIIQLWRDSAANNQLPSPEEIRHSRESSNWNLINFGFKSRVQKIISTVMVDLGGIAKGHAIDQAISEMQKHNIKGGLVEIGGDLRCFGTTSKGDKWKIDILNPFDQSICGAISIDQGAVCTSGNYYRFDKINCVDYSHIIDPRNGEPSDIVSSVTVVADDAITADVWATALSILGKDYIPKINGMDNIEVMIIAGEPNNVRVFMSKGFERLITQKFPDSWRIIHAEQ